MNSIEDGLRAQDASREEGRQEGEQECVQCEARPCSTGPPRKRDRIIYVQNSSNVRDPFILQEIATVREFLEAFCAKFPDFCSDSIGMKISTSRMGVMHRKMLSEVDTIPYEEDTLYIELYLKKHPPVAYSKN
jgi:hypothetical protein